LQTAEESKKNEEEVAKHAIKKAQTEKIWLIWQVLIVPPPQTIICLVG